MSQAQPPQDKLLTVELPVKHWVVVMACLQQFIKDVVNPAVADLRQKGQDVNSLSSPQVTALAGPVIALGVITKAMHAAGEVTAEGNAAVGIDAILARADEAARQSG